MDAVEGDRHVAGQRHQVFLFGLGGNPYSFLAKCARADAAQMSVEQEYRDIHDGTIAQARHDFLVHPLVGARVRHNYDFTRCRYLLEHAVAFDDEGGDSTVRHNRLRRRAAGNKGLEVFPVLGQQVGPQALITDDVAYFILRGLQNFRVSA